MTRSVITISPDSPLEDAYTLFRKEKISMLVVEQEGKAVGLLTERDAVRFIHDSIDVTHTLVVNVMSSPVTMVDEGLSLFEAYSILAEKHYRHLVVADTDGLLAGVVTLTDMLDGMGIEYFIDLKQVASIMTKVLIRVRPCDSMRLVLDLMQSHRISCVVVAEQWKPVGIITERDIVNHYDQQTQVEDIEVRSVMSSPVRVMPETAYIPEANTLMSDERLRHMVIVDSQGRLAGLISQTDLTSCMEAGYISYLKGVIEQRENELSQISYEHDAFLRENPNAVIAFDMDGNIINANPAALQLTGYDSETLTKKTLQSLLHPQDIEQTLKLFQQICTGQSVHTECRILRPSGSIINVFNSFLPIVTAGKVFRIYAVTYDITARKQTERQLHQSEKKFSVLAELSQAIPWSLDLINDRFGYVGKQVEQCLGYPVDSWLNMECWIKRIHLEDRDKVLNYCTQAIEHGEENQFECRMITADERVIQVQNYVSAQMLAGKAVELNGFILGLSDHQWASDDES
ncbi:CBS domain-containing protein [Mariprofundus sp. EBB-1]|uniref:CBS domain-containing protein n=1 Tax=Mariprofundus sp. EBB-1 TaxID=2650971 RepID=UPI001F42C8B5|nr:CBS domain-containing protein [Mariprofundus sp. EBB-1]